MKAYTAKSSAIRAAKKAHGTEWESKAAILATSEGKWEVIPAADNGHITAASAPAPVKAHKPVISQLKIVKSPWGGHAKAPWMPGFPVADAIIERLEGLVEKLEALPILKDAPTEAAPTSEGKADSIANRLAMGWNLSSVSKPTKLVHIIASEMPGASRKEVIEACIKAGIAPGTARTQYQAFYSARKADEQRRSNNGSK